MSVCQSFCSAFAVLLGLVAGPISIAASVPAVEGAPVLVVGGFGGGRDVASLVALAGGFQIGPEVAPIAVLAQSDDAGFVARLKVAGALLVLDGKAFAQICGIENNDYF